ncbi:hypothetical protein [Desulfosporosinus sp. BG]|uniref:hypothetical protein n=1 Tax=Desulfosporosinus sp. BG TaxID=1633135 RepID=UPI00083B2E59|nr:hypothetical protein [Desulfosporosinus sp. BG]ODA41471.1 hypothetical protein DSBG_1747 [Desulfosporosinus sp. BG]
MKKRLITIIAIIFLGNGLLIGGGTYALLTASATNTGNQFEEFQAETIDIQSLPESDTISAFQSRSLVANCCSQPVNLTMFYDHTIPGRNPYDVKTSYTPSGEIPGGWAPGDHVKRTWKILNSGAASKITEVYTPVDKFSLRDRNGNAVLSGSQVYQDFLNHMRIDIYYPEGSSTPIYTGTFQQLVQAPQSLDKVICLSKCSSTTVAFVASMDLNAQNDLQGVKGVLDFQLGVEQVKNNCFSPPFSNRNYSMERGSTTPIKFECYDSDGNLLTSGHNVKLVIIGRGLGERTYTLGNGLSLDGGHYQANVYAHQNLFLNGETYTATVYNGSQMCGQKTFITEPGNRSNVP